MSEDTIFAMATGAGRAAIAVLRLSGLATSRLVIALAGSLPPPRRAVLRRLHDAEGRLLDHALLLWMPAPTSYTGEDTAEFHLHGGAAVIDGVATALVAAGARPAEPGEFTRRAFLNNRMDLTEAEAVADLVAAETSAQRDQALRQLDGALGDLYRSWSARLRALLAQNEALIDFPDEDLPPGTEAAAQAELAALRAALSAHLDDNRRGERLREGLVFVLAGAANVGKSSLMNALAEREVAIVAAAPGTTRDILESRIVLAGVPITLLDTAGLRDTADPVEAEGVRRARARAAAADLHIHILDATNPAAAPTDALLIANKIDLAPAPPSAALGVSATTGENLPQLRTLLARHASRLANAAGPPALTRARHRAALAEAATRLTAASSAPFPELRAEDLRVAQRALGRVTGAVSVEDILDEVFARFCIGK